MGNQHMNSFNKTLIEINFLAFGQTKQTVEYFKDCTWDQACALVWKICPTAIILFGWQYGLTDPVQMKVTKKKLSDTELDAAYKKF